MIKKGKVDLKAEYNFYMSILSIVLFPSMLFFFVIVGSFGLSIPICIFTFTVIWLIILFFIIRVFYDKEKEIPKDKNSLIKFGEKIIELESYYFFKVLYFTLVTIFFITFVLIIQVYFYNIFKQVAIIFGVIAVILFFIIILIIDYLLFNTVRFSIYGKKLGLSQSDINLLFLDLKLNVSKEKERFLNKVSINKYCAIKRGICRKNIIYYGIKSCFFAFPFRNPFSDLMLKLKLGLEKIGFRVKMLTDDSFDAVLVCKLCREILSSNFIVCEVSELNRNVMFEYGYAKGVGKCGWLILKSSSNNELIKKGIFSDVIQFRYHDIGDVAREINNTLLFSGESQIISFPNIIGDCKNCNIEPNKKRCLIITPDIFVNINRKFSQNNKLISGRIERVLCRSGFKVYSIRENTEGHILCNYCKQIKRSNYIFAIYVPDNVPNNEVINSGLAFLIGLALAMGKKVLILQKKPIHHPMIDLKGAIQDFDNLQEINNKVKSFIKG